MTPEEAANMARRQAEADTAWIANWDNQRAANRAAKNYTNEVASIRAYYESEISDLHDLVNHMKMKLNNRDETIVILETQSDQDNDEITRLKNRVNLMIDERAMDKDKSNAEITRLNELINAASPVLIELNSRIRGSKPKTA